MVTSCDQQIMPVKNQPSILIVEDDENDILLIRRTLVRAGVPNRVASVTSAEAAIAYMAGQDPYCNRDRSPFPGLVLLDLKMPGLNGFDVLTWIRRQPRFTSLRIVVVTSSRDIRDVTRAYHLGADSFLVKPFEFENANALFNMLNAQGIWCQQTAPAVTCQ